MPTWIVVGTMIFLHLLAAPPAMAADLAATLLLPEGGQARPFEVALDEVSVRAPGSASRLAGVPALASAEAVRLHAELLGKNTGQEVELVLYEAGQPRHQFTRRILTRQVLAHLAPGMDPALLAAAHGVVSKGACPSRRVSTSLRFRPWAERWR